MKKAIESGRYLYLIVVEVDVWILKSEIVKSKSFY